MKHTATVIVTIFLVFFLVACERPAPGGGGDDQPSPLPPTATTTAGLPTLVISSPEETAPADTPILEEPTTQPVEEIAEEPTAEAPTEETGETPPEETTEEPTDETSTEETTEEPPIEAEPTATPPIIIPAGGITHTVQPGDTLYDISLAYGVSIEVIAQANNMSNPDALLSVGDILVIPDSNSVTEDDTQDGTTDTVGERTHIVQRGENLFRIGLSYGFTIEELASYNGITDPTRLSVGQEIKIPPPKDE